MHGRILLLRLLQTHTTREIGALCGACHSSVSRWASGRQLPHKAARRALLELGIPAESWGEPQRYPDAYVP